MSKSGKNLVERIYLNIFKGSKEFKRILFQIILTLLPHMNRDLQLSKQSKIMEIARSNGLPKECSNCLNNQCRNSFNRALRRSENVLQTS